MLDLVVNGDILTFWTEGIVIPVNCKGVMGAGLAKAAHEKWPDRCGAYMQACRDRALRPGGLVLDVREEQQERKKVTPRVLIFAATKDDWRKPSRIEWVARAAKNLNDSIGELKLASLAVPALGCGLGGLDWVEVHGVLGRAFRETKAKVYICEPQQSNDARSR